MKFITGLLIGAVLGFGICYANIGTIVKEKAKNDLYNAGETLHIVEEEISVLDVFDAVIDEVKNIFE